MKRRNLSLLVNLLALALVLLALVLRWLLPSAALLSSLLLSAGLYALAGALTNWLAIHMLFERIPLVYGSGIIALNFEEIKHSLEELMISQFFSREQIQKFLQAEMNWMSIDTTEITNLINYESLFQQMKQSLQSSNPLLAMALPILDNYKDQIIQGMRSAVQREVSREDFQDQLQKTLLGSAGPEDTLEIQARNLIHQRLAELTPQMVKEIVRDMLANKLVWLVIWGGIFGGLLGLGAGLLPVVGL